MIFTPSPALVTLISNKEVRVMKVTMLKRLTSAGLACIMALSFASCGLFGADKKAVTEAAENFAAALVKMDARKIGKLTDEKKKSSTLEELDAFLDKNSYSKDQYDFVEAVMDTVTYEVAADTVNVDGDKASATVVFTMVDYEDALKKGDFDDIDDVIDAVKDCEDQTEVEVELEFKKDGDSWLMSNLKKNKDIAELYECFTYDLGLKAPIFDMVEDVDYYYYTYPGSYYVALDVEFYVEDVSEYDGRMTADVYYEGDLIASDITASVYSSWMWVEYDEPDYYNLDDGDYEIVLKCDGDEWISKTMTVTNYNDGGSNPSSGYYDSSFESIVYYGYGPEEIELWSFTSEVPSMIDYYMNLNPDFASEYTVKCCVLSTSNGYTDLLDNGLEYGGSDGPDIYVVEGADVMEYSQGNMCNYAMSYEDLGIDIDSEIAAADIAQYTVDIGTNPNGEVVALGYQATGGAMIYRRSIAQDVFGTDDPDEISAIFGGGTGSWDAFWDAADVLKDNGVAVVSGTGDIWQVIYGSTDSWIKDGSLDTSSDRYEFFDMAYDLYDGGYTNNTGSWTEEWYDDMNGTGDRPVFAFFGPAWLMNYVMAPNCYDTYGDWAVCTPPVGFMWGGSWVFASANSDQADGVRDLIYWITLDTSTEGLQYLWANGWIYDNGTSDTVASGTVMNAIYVESDFLGGQDMMGVYDECNKIATGDCLSAYDSTINSCFTSAVDSYINPDYYINNYGDLDAAIDMFEGDVYTYTGF